MTRESMLVGNLPSDNNLYEQLVNARGDQVCDLLLSNEDSIRSLPTLTSMNKHSSSSLENSSSCWYQSNGELFLLDDEGEYESKQDNPYPIKIEVDRASPINIKVDRAFPVNKSSPPASLSEVPPGPPSSASSMSVLSPLFQSSRKSCEDRWKSGDDKNGTSHPIVVKRRNVDDRWTTPESASQTLVPVRRSRHCSSSLT